MSFSCTPSPSPLSDNPEIFYEDIAKSARHLLRPELARVMATHSAPAVEWLVDNFGVLPFFLSFFPLSLFFLLSLLFLSDFLLLVGLVVGFPFGWSL